MIFNGANVFGGTWLLLLLKVFWLTLEETLLFILKFAWLLFKLLFEVLGDIGGFTELGAIGCGIELDPETCVGAATPTLAATAGTAVAGVWTIGTVF